GWLVIYRNEGDTMNVMNYSAPRPSRLAKLSAWVLALVLVVAVAGAAYYFLGQRSERADLERRNQQLQAQVQQLQNDKQSNQSDQLPADRSRPTNIFESSKGVDITVYSPLAQDTVDSPLGVIGKAPGNWSFEASFPVVLKDANGQVIAETTAKMQGDWMTDEDVPFAASLTFDKPATSTGTLVLQNDNPSGEPENDDSVSIPVKF
ncbi:MAG TPA: Gmad2 immunoglobulin-like domain-containing protein, partial [Candidatus Saccharimonadales bacterium]|nr:Gmad2 immunoglobulin-like domain-containing protein [Candidatus Saccharimonadales bacterium]